MTPIYSSIQIFQPYDFFFKEMQTKHYSSEVNVSSAFIQRELYTSSKKPIKEVQGYYTAASLKDRTSTATITLTAVLKMSYAAPETFQHA